MSDTISTESALLAAREQLHALGVPADEIPNELVPVAVGGSLMPSLPGWTEEQALEWAAIAVCWPDAARRIVAWTEANADRLANLRAIRPHVAKSEQVTIYVDLEADDAYEFTGRRPSTRAIISLSGTHRGLCPREVWESGQAIEWELDWTLDIYRRLHRRWHAELSAAIAAAWAGPRIESAIWEMPGGGYAVSCPLTATTDLRIVPHNLIVGLIGCTNATPFCGAKSDELRLRAVDTDLVEIDSVRGHRTRLRYHFDFRPDMPWNQFLSPDGTWQTLQLFEPADFFELP